MFKNIMRIGLTLSLLGFMSAAAARADDFDKKTGSSPVAGTRVKQTNQSARLNARHLPNTASALPLIVLLGFASLGVAFSLMIVGRRATTPAV